MRSQNAFILNARRLVKLLNKAKSHPVIILCVAIAAILTFITDTLKRIGEVLSWSVSVFNHDKKTCDMLGQIFNGESRQNLESMFGVPKTEYQLTNNFVVCTYSDKDFKLIAIYENKSLEAYSITTRRRGFNPTLRITSDRQCKLGKTTFNEATGGNVTPDEWDCSVVPKDYLFFETEYLGNEHGYQTCLLAYSQIEGAREKFDLDSANWLDTTVKEVELNREIKLTPVQKEEYRKKLCANSAPNIIGFSALYFPLGKTPVDLGFDLSRVLIYTGETTDESF